MRKLFSLVAVLAGLVMMATPASAQRGGAQAAQAAAEPGAWCNKCVEPGICVSTGSGEWGYTYCRGLGNDQCAAGGNYCMWSTGGANVVKQDVQLADGGHHMMTPLAEFVLVASDCEEGSLLVVEGVTGPANRVDGGATAWASMRLAGR